MSDLVLASRESTEEESAPSVRRGPNAAHPACATRVAPSPLLAMADASVAIRRLLYAHGQMYGPRSGT
jgi:hypothetical protein